MNNQYYFEQTHYDGKQPISVWYPRGLSGSVLFPYHWHHGVELVLVTQGDILLSVDEQMQRLPTGDIAIINADQIHYGCVGPDGPAATTVVLFDFDKLLSKSDIDNDPVLDSILCGDMRFPPHISPNFSLYDDILRIVDRITACWEVRRDGYKLHMKALAFEFLYQFASHKELLSTAPYPSKFQKHRRLMEDVIQYLEEHYREKITVADLAAAVYMGENTFYKFMTSMTGQPPVAFVNRFRLQKAARMLESTDSPITDICFDVGFSNVSYFIKSFRDLYGATPRQYRRSQG